MINKKSKPFKLIFASLLSTLLFLTVTCPVYASNTTKTFTDMQLINDSPLLRSTASFTLTLNPYDFQVKSAPFRVNGSKIAISTGYTTTGDVGNRQIKVYCMEPGGKPINYPFITLTSTGTIYNATFSVIPGRNYEFLASVQGSSYPGITRVTVSGTDY